MAKSFENIDYRLRPSKNVERKMILDLLRGLTHLNDVDNYQYIGFGSTYFVDFRLFHRRLGIDDMISIEKEEDEQCRVKYNRPYSCIDIQFGRSDDEIPHLNLEKPTILWLDYEEELTRYMFHDIEQFCASAPAGSLIFITINADPMNERVFKESNYDSRYEKLEQKLGKQNIPPGVKKKDLRGWGKSDAYREILLEKIKTDFLKPRNGGRESDMKFNQLVNFRYRDSQPMMTIGGMLYSDEIESEYQAAKFEELDFVRTDQEHCEISTPKLTPKEMRGLNQLMPSDPVENWIPVPEDDKEDYARIYKYYPKFVETHL